MRERVLELISVFLRLGFTAFGGPAAHIAMMEAEIVRKRRWLTHEEFLDLLGATHLIPGPNSTEMAIHIGLKRGGWPGFAAAGLAFILPAALIVTGIAWIYVRFGSLPQVEGLLYGIKPIIIAIVIQALWNLGRAAIKTNFLGALAIAAVILNAMGLGELAVLFGIGSIPALMRLSRGKAAMGLLPFAGGAAAGAIPFSLGALFLFFLKVGAVLFGSGYVLLAFLQADLVEERQWLTSGQLLDAIAVGQMTPGPVFTTATFIGYLLAGGPGAAVATIGIFLPAFVFVAASGWLIPHMRRSPVAGAFLDGVNVASLALMAVVTWRLAASAIVDPVTGALAIVSAVLLIRWRLNSIWLILGGGLSGLITQLLR